MILINCGGNRANVVRATKCSPRVYGSNRTLVIEPGRGAGRESNGRASEGEKNNVGAVINHSELHETFIIGGETYLCMHTSVRSVWKDWSRR